MSGSEDGVDATWIDVEIVRLELLVPVNADTVDAIATAMNMMYICIFDGSLFKSRYKRDEDGGPSVEVDGWSSNVGCLAYSHEN